MTDAGTGERDPTQPPPAPAEPMPAAAPAEPPPATEAASAEVPPQWARHPERPHVRPAPIRPTPEPTRTLEPAARTMWTIQAAGFALPIALVAYGLSLVVVTQHFGPPWLPTLIWTVAGFAAFVRIFVVPAMRVRIFRYEVREQEIDLRRGTLIVRRTLIPMGRVQHVETKRTVLSEAFGLAAVVFHTAAGSREIPALPEAEAAEIRDRIADLAGASDEPV